ncbi:tRNA N(3)-methylcytidine methyltransferase METTL2A isoform X3 [Neovison vison]|uniref:tRNA N(3)-methylcytidine methyltransferase METTL2A isoform X3 n=1 Tax=Neovison vison TaxID=452646 RepID=UPI001CEFDACB|nr:tRNA N(3)-methylcytidine methyltransferase METTL2A isoform X3 [Neogale vison]
MADSHPECAPAAVGEKRQQFGSRFLSDPARVFHHNAWDNVEWSEEQAAAAERKVQENSTPRVCQEKQVDYEVNAHKYWNEFYKIHENGFFKDRHWLFTEFPELAPNPNHNDLNDWLSENKRSEVPEAIELVRTNSAYDPRRCFAFVHDLCDEDATYPVPGGSLDVIILIFVLSAVVPDKMQKAISRLSRLLKPGGMMLLRDYGRYDMAQLRFKKGQCLSESFYVRGDGTRVYFFTQEELDTLFTTAGLEKVQNLVDRRLQVNRGKQLTMYRVWIQCKYRKPLVSGAGPEPPVPDRILSSSAVF